MISVLRFLGSLRVGVALLLAIFGLVFWGTLFEARAGVELGTERFFDSWIFFAAGIFPLPALKTLAIFLVVNLLCALLFRIPRTKKNVGIWILHFSLLILIAGSFLSHASRENFDAFGFVGASLPLDEKAENSLRLLNADSMKVCALNGAGDSIFIAANSPQTIGDYQIYFAETIPMNAEKTIVRLHIRRDPFDFVPKLFALIFCAGIFLQCIFCRGKNENF